MSFNYVMVHDEMMKLVRQMIDELATLDDAAFVDRVRSVKTDEPAINSLRVWHEAVRRELDMRLLLKLGQQSQPTVVHQIPEEVVAAALDRITGRAK